MAETHLHLKLVALNGVVDLAINDLRGAIGRFRYPPMIGPAIFDLALAFLDLSFLNVAGVR